MRQPSRSMAVLAAGLVAGGWLVVGGGSADAGSARGLPPSAVAAPRAAALAPLASRPIRVSGSTWAIRDTLTSGGPTRTFSYGNRGDFPVSGDWDGNGTLTPGVVRGNTWYLRNAATTGNADLTFTYGLPGDTPVVGDWDGNGSDTPGVVRGNVWWLRNANSAGPSATWFSYGNPSDKVVAGDWNGDGRTTPGVVRGNAWYLRQSNTAGGTADVSFAYGNPTDRPTAGDWDANGTETPGVVRGLTWYLKQRLAGGAADLSLTFGDACDPALSTSSALARERGGGPLRSPFVGTELNALPTSANVVALTFDAGANAAGVSSILSTLRAQCAAATFFLTGAWVRSFPVQTREIGLRFPVGNHTDTHPDLTTLSDAAVRDQVLRAQSAISTGSRYHARPMFRFPYGARDARTIGIVNSLGYTSVRWTVDTLGWQGTSGGQSTQTVVNRVLANLRPGAIVLMHVGSHPTDGSTLDADALPTLIQQLRARGYGFVAVPTHL